VATLSVYAGFSEEDGIVGNGLSSDAETVEETEASDVILLRGCVGVCVGR